MARFEAGENLRRDQDAIPGQKWLQHTEQGSFAPVHRKSDLSGMSHEWGSECARELVTSSSASLRFVTNETRSTRCTQRLPPFLLRSCPFRLPSRLVGQYHQHRFVG